MYPRSVSRRQEILREASQMTSEIYLAGGCFWGLEAAFSAIHGVISTECGYANGDPHYIPDYMFVCSGRFGYRETVKVVYNPDVIPLECILWSFFFLIDPTQERRQGNDRGIQYQTGVYWVDDDSAERVRRYFEKEAPKHSEFHTECGPLTFYSPAEEYHQHYLDKNPGGYCHIPREKIEVLRRLSEETVR